MRPLIYSETEAKRTGKGWVRAGGDICYYQNSMRRKNAGYYYTLTFSITFEHDSDVVYFAHSYPYTYTDLQRYLDKLEADPKRKNRLRRKTLCQTKHSSFWPQGAPRGPRPSAGALAAAILRAG